MMKRTMLGLGAVALAAGVFALTQPSGRADGDVKLVVPESVAADLIKDDIGIVNSALNPKEKLVPKDIKRAKVATLMIAMNAKATKNDALYAQAVKVLEALAKEDSAAEAKAAAEGLSKPTAGDAKGDPIKLALWDADNKTWDKDLAMQLFKTPRAGGLGYEKVIKDYAEKNPPASELAKIATLAYKTAMLTQVLHQIAPTTSAGAGKGPEDWKRYAENLQKSAIEVGEAAAKKDAKGVKAALSKMDTSCVNCHEKFKPQ